jgi:chemotaxis family two-component system response regulator Rcp1
VREITVLCVEDSDAFAYAMRLAVADLKVRLFRVVDGEQAMRFLRREKPYDQMPAPDLIFLDLNLPKQSGFDLLAELRTDPVLSRIPAVVLTSSNSPSDRKKSIELGAREYIMKPSDFERLTSEVAATCQRYVA